MSNHLSRYLLLGVANGEIPIQDALRMMLDHLVDQCPECQRVLNLVGESLGLEDLLGQPSLTGAGYLNALEKDRQHKEESARRVIQDLVEAGEAAPRRVREGSKDDYVNPVLAQLLISRAWTACKARKPGAGALGLAAVEVGRRLRDLQHYLELSYSYRLAGLTVAANAARIEDRFEDAFRLLEEAQELVQDVADPGVLSDYFRVLGSTHLDAGSPAEAAVAFKQSVHLAADARDSTRLTKVSLKLAELQRTAGKRREAVALLEDALENLKHASRGSERDYLTFVTQANLAIYWCELGIANKAESVLQTINPSLFSRFGREARLPWIQGLISRAQGHQGDAISKFREAQRLLELRGFLLESGVVALDIARSALEIGDREQLTLAARDLERLSAVAADALVASQLYVSCLALQTGTLTLRLIDDLYEKLRRRCN